ncbi:DUF2079 domain-containing protein, partial [Candidatus Gottesmanbacteria bacterium]|nr:DUF2079 domain-containing protein [Candidatus Gottesmanbacteria bacterium]
TTTFHEAPVLFDSGLSQDGKRARRFILDRTDTSESIERGLMRLLVIWIILLSVLYSTLSILRHNHFQSGGFDLGIYDQAVWQYAHFQWPYNTIKDRFILGDHLTLTLPLLTPLFWLWEDVRMLLIFQAVWISFSALAIYKIALLRLSKFDALTTITRPRYVCQWTALCLAIVYSLFYGIQYLVYFDFHPVVIGVGFLAWAAYFLESGKNRWLVASISLLLLTQENMGLALAGLGLICLFRLSRHSRERGNPEYFKLDPRIKSEDDRIRRAGVWFIVLGIAASLAAARIVAAFSPVGFEYQPEIPRNPWVILSRFFDHPEKLHVWWWSFASFSFLPLLSPGAVLAVVSDLAQYFATGDHFVQMWTPYKHHRAILGVFLTLGTLDALVLLKRWKISPERVAVVLLGVALILQYLWHLPLNKLTKAEYWKQETWMVDNRKLFALVPAGAAVATQQNIVSHLSHRNQIYLAWPRLHDFADNPCGQTSCWWLDFDKRAEYLVVDTRPDQWLTQILESNEHWREAIRNMEKIKIIKLVESVGFARMYEVSSQDVIINK